MRYIVLTFSEIYRRLFPQSAEKNLRRLLLTPQSRPPAAVPNTIIKEMIDTPYGSLAHYSIGRGPIVLFIHGWSGSASQFFSLMEKVADLGYNAITFDHYKHGYSTGKENNYPLFVEAIKQVIEQMAPTDKLACVVSHSMGCSATIDVFQKQSIPHFLISHLFDFYGELVGRITGAGISHRFFEQIISSIESDYNTSIKDRDPIRDIATIDSPIHIIHSEDDQFALYKLSQRVAERHENIALETISNIGHMRIVKIEETEKALTNFILKISEQ